ncbi:MAG: hypothetical protein IPM45_00575 [Acidimicrobiales bacterium]|nr:hypothetical protein [Acidimicrobiales bacterium]
MSAALLVLVAVAVVNPPVVWLAQPPSGVSSVARVLGVLAAGAVAVALAGASGPILDALSISASSFWWGAGAVLLLVGARLLLLDPPEPFPVAARWPGWAQGLVPLGFPLLVTPALAVAAVAYGSDQGAAAGFALTAVIAATAAACGPGGRWRAAAPGARLLRAAARFAAAGLMVAGADLVHRGVTTL